MPQLEFATYASQIFWLAVIFAVLYIFLARVSLPVIFGVLNNRQSLISENLKKAENLKNDAKAAEVDFTTVISDARRKASLTLSAAKAKIASEEVMRNAEFEKTFLNQSKDSERKMSALRKEAVENLIPVVSQSASMIAEKLIGIKFDKKHAEKLAMEISNSILIK